MAGRYLETHFTPEVLAAQQHYFGRAQNLPPQPERDPLTTEETEFIARRDSFYMATVTSNGWPYVQHRGGRPGFLKVTGPNELAFADYKGNRQMLSTGNLAATDRVALFLMDYLRQERLKILGHARVLDAREHPDLIAQVAEESDRKLVDRHPSPTAESHLSSYRASVRKEVMSISQRTPHHARLLQPLREIGRNVKSQIWDDEEIMDALREAYLQDIDPASLYEREEATELFSPQP